MAEEQAAEGGMNNILPSGNIFVYTGEQEVPADVTHVIIDRSIKIIPEQAFYGCEKLVSVEFHDGVEEIKGLAFDGCHSLRGIKLPGVKEVGWEAFMDCFSLTDVEFGDKLEIIGRGAFNGCHSLRKIKMQSVRRIGCGAFSGYCEQLTDVELPAVEWIGNGAFNGCRSLRRIAIPSKGIIFSFCIQERYYQFRECENLTTVDLVGGIHKTIASLLLESWKDDMNQEIGRINQVLPITSANEKTDVIKQWIRSVLERIEYFKDEHKRLLKKVIPQLLALAVWKAKLDVKEEDDPNTNVKVQAKEAKIDVEGKRKERRITSGADIIIRNVLPFLKLE
jgi:hypothetical protein